ncbi:NAD-dependent epimerase/dehydratase family protein [Patulibacter sp.]|uniref:NAD-dependent epimerase/dehydratase family protein n=1 Tax=Patulibacter sp. TaxID=1912859 RepID=UPI0027275483|nr:NAD-dependent epimerase/dehydratase family protein [Patulibacter sp.]MDO9410190.1 NAD-dependent epimerase/dehydratase family protein [Patulibacter sp.]
MRIVIVGATGNVGSSLVRALVADPGVDEVVGFARRRPDGRPGKVEWVAGDVRTHDLASLFAGADAVVHLAWRIQPSRDRELTRATDVGGSARVLDAVAAAGVPLVVHASSLAAYGPHGGRPDERVDESWPTTGVASSFYSREKVAVEGLLNEFEAGHPEVRVVRMRPALIFQRSAAQEIRRYFLGPFWPSALVRPGRVPVVPLPPALRFQVVHADDVAEAYRLVLRTAGTRGAYNVAAEPVITPRRFARVLGGRLGGLPVPVPARALRLVAKATWLGRVQPTPPGWVDLAMQSPLLATDRIRALGWTPRHDGPSVLRELLEGLHDRAGGDTPPLRADAGGRFRQDEIRTGVGGGA